MAKSRFMAVKNLRRSLIRIQHPDITIWSDRELKKLVMSTGHDWLNLLVWFTEKLDVEMTEFLCHTTVEERASRIGETISHFLLYPEERLQRVIQGRVSIEERENLVLKLIELVEMKKALDSGIEPCYIQSPGFTSSDLLKHMNKRTEEMLNLGKSNCDLSFVLTGRELFLLLLEKYPEYQQLLSAANKFMDSQTEEQSCGKDEVVNDLSSEEGTSETKNSKGTATICQGLQSLSINVLKEETETSVMEADTAEEKQKMEKGNNVKPLAATHNATEVGGDSSPNANAVDEPSSPHHSVRAPK